MNNNKSTSKSTWDKLDVLGKLISSVLLATIAIVIKYGADNIATSLQSGQLVQSLIADLTTQETGTRQDIALIKTILVRNKLDNWH